jgi:acetyl esterase
MAIVPPRPTFPARLRQHAGAFAVDSFFRLASRAGRLHPAARPERHGLERVRDVPYRDTGLPEHLLDVYRPSRREGPLPAVLYLHGGGFRILSKDSHWIMGLAFARRGMVVFNVSYRLAPRHPFPAAVEDVFAAYRWVVDNAATWGADPTRIVVAGESAGANLAMAVTLASCWRRPEPFAREVFETGVVPRAVLPACGMYQITDPDRFRRRRVDLHPFFRDRLHEVAEAYLRGVPEDGDPAARDLADPVVFLERGQPPDRPLPPFFAGVGTRDPLLDDTRRLARALEALGAPVEARYYRGELHAFHAVVFLPQARRFWADTYAFLDRTVPR